MRKRNGYMEGGEYIITWVFGHLFSLADVEAYQENPSRYWTMDCLPCFPEQFRFELRKNAQKQPDEGVRRQFEIISGLVNRNDVDMVINAGDADREGEIIVRICVEKALKTQKSFYRLWLPDQTPETIRQALSEMKEETEYRLLADEGFARTYIDWLYGVNLTRYATLKHGSLLRVGRVIVPIVKAIYDRDKSIREFVPEPYYALVSKAETNGETVELTSKEKFSENEKSKAEELCRKYNASEAIVTAKKKKNDKIAPGKLYSLTKLQNVLGKKYKMSMDESLKIVQALYEKGFVTYPRTNSEYLATAEQDKVKNIIAAVKKLGYNVEFRFHKTIFDDSKIESHSALTPTHKIPSKNALSDDEYKVYSTIMRRFAAVFCAEECRAEKTEITVDVGGMEEFKLKGMVMVQPGWTKYDDYGKKDKVLPMLKKGDKVNIDFKPCKKKTTPPRHYTIETLNKYLKNPFENEKKNRTENDDEEEYRAMFEGLELGTEATRTGIIDNARKSGYIQLKKDVYYIQPAGAEFIEALMRMNISMDKYKTAELGKALKSVYHGRMTIKDSVKIAQNEISAVFAEKSVPPQLDTDDGFMGDVAGKCPLCGGNVVRTKFGYGCENYRNGCKFTISRIICGRVIPIKSVETLLKSGMSGMIDGFVSPRNGKRFSAKLKIDNGRAVFAFEQ